MRRVEAGRKDVYVGALDDAHRVLQSPKRSHIASIIAVTYSRLPVPNPHGKKIVPVLQIPIDDDGEKCPYEMFDLAVAFFEKTPRPILIICDAGINRSTSFATACVWFESWKKELETIDEEKALTLQEALELCRHPISYPPKDWLKKLRTWAYTQYGKWRFIRIAPTLPGLDDPGSYPHNHSPCDYYSFPSKNG